MGKYEDQVLCDVALIDAGRIILSRPWQFDQRVVHDRYTNKYSLVYKGRSITLVPSTLGDKLEGNKLELSTPFITINPTGDMY